MVGYKLSKNNWVTPSFVIFRSVREKLLVTVFFDHPVSEVNESHFFNFETRMRISSIHSRTSRRDENFLTLNLGL